MQANWSLILNILLLVVVIIAIVRMIKARRPNSTTISRSRERTLVNEHSKPNTNHTIYGDDIIAVRKVGDKDTEKNTSEKTLSEPMTPRLIADGDDFLEDNKSSSKINSKKAPSFAATEKTLMMFLVARENRQFAGYELLQTVLAAGLRFGDDGLFHRHQLPNGDGDIICSLASATATGTFDLQNIGAFSVRGLCLYMHLTTSTQVNKDRFTLMLNTANVLMEGLDAHLLDDERQPITDERLTRYQHDLQNEVELV